MINGVLVERTVKDVVPALRTNAEGLKKVLDDLVKQYKAKQDELEKWKVWTDCPARAAVPPYHPSGLTPSAEEEQRPGCAVMKRPHPGPVGVCEATRDAMSSGAPRVWPACADGTHKTADISAPFHTTPHGGQTEQSTREQDPDSRARKSTLLPRPTAPERSWHFITPESMLSCTKCHVVHHAPERHAMLLRCPTGSSAIRLGCDGIGHAVLGVWVGRAGFLEPGSNDRECPNRHDCCDGGFRCSAVPEAPVESMLLSRPGRRTSNGRQW